jgi:hypothetical protein
MKKGNRRKATRSLGMIFSLGCGDSTSPLIPGGGEGFISFRKSRKTSLSILLLTSPNFLVFNIIEQF